MTKQNYEKLTDMIRQLWEPNRGLVVELRKNPSTEEPTLVLTAGRELNPRFVVRNCRIWQGETCLADNGALLNNGVRPILSANRICHAAFRTANTTIDSRDWKTKRLCLGNPETCKRNCPLKGKANAQSNAVSRSGEAVSQSGDSK